MHCFASSFAVLFQVLLVPSLFLWTVANDTCQDAIAITTLPFAAQGNLALATADFDTPVDMLRNLTCGIATDAPGVWYRIDDGMDQFYQAVLTDANHDDSSTKDTKFITALFSSSSSSAATASCDEDSLTCMAFREYQLEQQRTQPTSTWFGEKGKTYYLHVAGVDATQVGGYNLQVTVRRHYSWSFASVPRHD